jgi:hypothetical protein
MLVADVEEIWQPPVRGRPFRDWGDQAGGSVFDYKYGVPIPTGSQGRAMNSRSWTPREEPATNHGTSCFHGADHLKLQVLPVEFFHHIVSCLPILLCQVTVSQVDIFCFSRGDFSDGNDPLISSFVPKRQTCNLDGEIASGQRSPNTDYGMILVLCTQGDLVCLLRFGCKCPQPEQ